VLNGGAGDDFLAGELPPDSEPPGPLPPKTDRCHGASGFDIAVDCDSTTGAEG
jgi:hypothetical protein